MIQTKRVLLLILSFIVFSANAQWVSIPITSQNCSGLDFYDANTGFIGCADGNDYVTNNKGTSWLATSNAFTTDIEDAIFVSKKKIILSSTIGQQFYSDDQGKNWTVLNNFFTNIVTSLDCSDSNKVHLVTRGGHYAWVTFNNGLSSTLKNDISTTDLFGVHFPDTTTGYACGDKGFISKTSNGGNNWNTQNSASSATLNSIFFLDKKTGWVVGSDQTVLLTTNGGITWKQTSYKGGGTGTTYRSVKFVNAKRGYLCGDFGTIMKSTDGGNTWKPMQTGNYESLKKLAFPDSLNGWAVGTNGTILYLNEDKTVPKVQTVTPSDTFMCTTGTYSVQFAVNKKFNAGNVFTAQLSDGQGAWGSPQTLGTLASDTSGSISFTLGTSQVLDAGYRIRIVSSNPTSTSVQTQSPLSVDMGISATASITFPNTVCEGTALTLNGVYTNGGDVPTFQWYVNGVAANNTSTTFISSTLKKSDQLSFQMYSTANCPVPKWLIATINAPVTPQPAKPTITQNGFVLTSSANTGNQWELNGTSLAGANGKQYVATRAGTYSVLVSEGACSSEVSDPVQVIVTGLDENESLSGTTTIYPVPCTNVLHFKAGYAIQTALLKDLTGRTLWQEPMNLQNTGTIELTTTGICTGMYYLELLDADGKPHRQAFSKQ